MNEDDELRIRRRGGVSAALAGNFGKLPPQAVDLEEIVLGAIMLEKQAMDEVINLLHDDAFYKDTHKTIYKACKSLYYKANPIDISTVVQELKRTGELDIVGGAYAISLLTNRLSSSANIVYHSLILLQQYARREVIRVCGEAIRDAYDDTTDPFALVDGLDANVGNAKQILMGKSETMEWKEQLTQTVDKIEKLYRSEVKMSGVPTSSSKLDELTGGWQETDLILLAGRPSQGKTTRVLNIIKAALKAGYPVDMFSLEMSWGQIVQKMLNEESEIYIKKMRRGDLTQYDFEKIVDAKNALFDLPFTLNDKSSINPNYIRTALRQRRKKGKLGLVVVDYVQIATANEAVKGRSRDLELGTVSSAMKAIAKEFNIPVILLSQLSRKCEERSDKRPILSDLRESGNLEQDADMVAGIYRPSYYWDYDSDPDYKEDRDSGMTEEQYNRISELIILKHRQGETGKIEEKFYGELSRFTDVESVKTVETPVERITQTEIDMAESTFKRIKPNPNAETTHLEDDDNPF